MNLFVVCAFLYVRMYPISVLECLATDVMSLCEVACRFAPVVYVPLPSCRIAFVVAMLCS